VWDVFSTWHGRGLARPSCWAAWAGDEDEGFAHVLNILILGEDGAICTVTALVDDRGVFDVVLLVEVSLSLKPAK
jgi:hypothetical protein